MKDIIIRLSLPVLAMIAGFTTTAQVKLGTNPTVINAGSILELESTTKAFTLPRMTGVQMNAIASPLNGMMIYNTDTACICMYRGGAWKSNCTTYTGSVSPILDVTSSADQLSIPVNVWTKLSLNSIVIDNNSNFNTATNRFTPTVAGYYRVSGSMYAPYSYSYLYIGIGKNGSIYKSMVSYQGQFYLSQPLVNTIVYMNGTTDFLELYTYMGTSATSYAGARMEANLIKQ
jgi:hypothetical protein